ncbi:uncharacterized protein [Cicer arietinum]|uniref:Uncharacterized protein LOC101489994 isoform X2 n=1 Tax=Cicer arietinum TaxID=3827 RepID=A0A1S2YRB1_CICAR|nr:uncharacterized protein LOC101489994 isoform X2 [Cicer arietinum]
MPGNEVGDRVHNFFGQENLSQGQYHSQAVDGNWPGLSNNLWAGSQRPTGGPFISNLKNFNVQQSDSEQGHASSLHLRHGLNLAQSNLRPDIGRNQTPNQQSAVNGYMQGHQVFQSRQNEANILGVDTGADLHGISSLSRGINVLESQQGAALDHYKKNLTRTDASESPVNYDFFGGQQQISSRHSGMLQSFPRQQSGMNDMQLLQQQAMLNQMQELQRQQQFHQLEARQQSSMAPASSISKQTVANQSASLINGIPINEASNLMWQPEVMASNANWLQRGASPVMQGSPNGFVLSPEQMRLMGLFPNQADQSLYGLPISGSRGAPGLYSHVQADKSAMPQVSIQNQYSRVQGDKQSLPPISTSVNAFPAHQYAAMSDQTNSNDGNSVSRQDIQGKSMFSSIAQGINSGLNMENLQQMNSEQRDVPMEDFHSRQELAGSSETSQDKMIVQVPPHNVATLDPTEEKILFGSDDNLWDGFGRNSAFNMLDSSDGFSGLPSLQSGSWSALMQSAVAETSSSEMGIQEEWSGLSSRNTERSLPNERPSPIDSSKQPSVWADNNLQSAPNINSRPLIRPEDLSRPNSTVNYSGLPGFHQPSADTAQEQHNRLHADSIQRSNPQILERGKWLNCSPQQKPVAEGSHVYRNAANSSGLEINEKVISGSWNHQQMLSSPNRSSEPFNRSNGWNAIKSAPPDNSLTPKTRENESVFLPHRDMSQVPTAWDPDSNNNSSTALEHVKSAGNMQVCGEDSGMNGIVAIPSSGATWVSRAGNHQHSNVDAWRHADSAGNYGRNEGAGKFRHHMEKNPFVLESSKDEKSEGEARDMENSNKKDKSADGIESNSSFHRASGVRENPGFEGSDLQSPKLPGQGNRRPVTRKFQYHPMGDVGVEIESYGNKHIVSSQPMPHQPFGGLKGREQSYPGQSKYGHFDENYPETEKGDKNSFDDNASKSELSSHVPKASMPFDRNVGNYASNQTAPPSQNILELLHKVDQSREHGIATNTSTSNSHLSSRVMDNESSDGSIVHPQRNQSSSSQGFGLQLAPPTQRLSMASSHATPHVASEMVDKGHTWLGGTQTFPSRESSHEIRNSIGSSSGQIIDKASQYNALGNIQQGFTSGFPFSRIHAQNQNMANLGGLVANTQCDNASFIDRVASTNQVDEYCERAQTSQSAVSSAQDIPKLSGINQARPGDPTMQISALEAGTAPHPSVTFSASLHGTSSKVLRNVWTSVSGMQQPNPLKAPSHPQPIINCGTATGPQKPHIEDSENDAYDFSGKQILPEVVDAAEEIASASCEKEHIVKSTPDASQSSPAATSRDIEDFGRSLRPNTFLHQNFSMLNQVQSMSNMEVNPIDQDIKKFNVSDDVVDKQFDSKHEQRSYGYNNLVEDVSGCNSLVPGDGRETNASSEEVVGYGQKNAFNVANSNKVTSVRSDHSLINPQMAPSWFEQYGTFKNGKMLPMYDGHTMTPKIMDQPYIVKNQSASLHLSNSMEQVNSLNDAGEHGHARLSPMPTSVVNVPSQLLSPHTVEPDLHVMRPKKRKSATSELMAWHKELKQGSERLQDIREAELDWAQAANRLIEKVEDEAVLVEDVPTMKSKRRLVLTTQLMQQLLNPPPTSVLCADVKLHHESVVYSVARLVLGDACSSVSLCESDTLMPLASKNLPPNKLKSSDKIDQYILKVEDFSDRARKLENDMLRLENRASILDLRVECQDLERFSVINRFAKFHGRGQNDGAETSSSSEATAHTQKSYLQKYVTAVPMPRNLPDRVQCLSL